MHFETLFESYNWGPKELNKNSSGDEIANVNFFATTSYNTSKYNPLLNIQHEAGRGAASGYGLVVLVRRFIHALSAVMKSDF